MLVVRRAAISVIAVGCRPVVKSLCQSFFGPRTGAGFHRFFGNSWRQKDDMKQVLALTCAACTG